MLPDREVPVHTETLVILLILMKHHRDPKQQQTYGSVTQLRRDLSRKIDLLNFDTFTDLKAREAQYLGASRRYQLTHGYVGVFYECLFRQTVLG